VRAITGKLAQEIIELDLGSVLRAQASEAIAAAPNAVPAAHADDDERIESEPIARHESRVACREQKWNIWTRERALRGGAKRPGGKQSKRLLGENRF
jgi:hypothetical protein